VKKIASYLAILPAVVLANEDKYGPEPAKIEDIALIISRILNIVVRLAGIAAFIMLIVGGFQYLTAAGNPEKTKAASQTITYAIFGLVAVIAAWFIMLFIEKFTGINLTTNITIPYKTLD